MSEENGSCGSLLCPCRGGRANAFFKLDKTDLWPPPIHHIDAPKRRSGISRASASEALCLNDQAQPRPEYIHLPI